MPAPDYDIIIVGTDRSKALIGRLMAALENRGVLFRLECAVSAVFGDSSGIRAAEGLLESRAKS